MSNKLIIAIIMALILAYIAIILKPAKPYSVNKPTLAKQFGQQSYTTYPKTTT